MVVVVVMLVMVVSVLVWLLQEAWGPNRAHDWCRVAADVIPQQLGCFVKPLACFVRVWFAAVADCVHVAQQHHLLRLTLLCQRCCLVEPAQLALLDGLPQGAPVVVRHTSSNRIQRHLSTEWQSKRWLSCICRLQQQRRWQVDQLLPAADPASGTREPQQVTAHRFEFTILGSIRHTGGGSCYCVAERRGCCCCCSCCCCVVPRVAGHVQVALLRTKGSHCQVRALLQQRDVGQSSVCAMLLSGLCTGVCAQTAKQCGVLLLLGIM